MTVAAEGSTVGSTVPVTTSAPPAPEPVTPAPAAAVAPTNGAPAAAAPVPEPKKEDERFAPRFAALARKEKGLVEKEKGLSEREKTLAEREAKLAGYESLKDRAKKDPVSVMNELDMSYEQLTRMILNDGKPTDEDKVAELERKVEEERQARIAKEKAEADRELAAQKEWVDRQFAWYKDSIKRTVASAPDEYELIIANDAQDLVWSVTEEWFNETGEILPPAEAAKRVEAHLTAEAEKLLKTKKLSAKLAPQSPPAEQAKANGADPITEAARTLRSARTLTNSQTHSDPTPKPQALSREERIKAAEARLVFKS